ncbi:MAG: isochorismatase family protein [Cytophagaceae bacterium]|nr:isochorismatase family protein [Gemmatimonadaceae bacterium]
MSSASQHQGRITPSDTAIVLVDHQPGVLAMVGSLPASAVTANAGMLARLGEEMGIPLVITSTRETLEFLGTNLDSISEAAPVAYARRVRRAGSLNAFDDPAFVDAVRNTQRKKLVIAGLLTDVCLFHSVRSGLDAGYEVHVVADASGTTTALGDLVTYDRLRELGAVVTTTYGTIFELYPDLSSEEGQRAEGVATRALVPA